MNNSETNFVAFHGEQETDDDDSVQVSSSSGADGQPRGSRIPGDASGGSPGVYQQSVANAGDHVTGTIARSPGAGVSAYLQLPPLLTSTSTPKPPTKLTVHEDHHHQAGGPSSSTVNSNLKFTCTENGGVSCDSDASGSTSTTSIEETSSDKSSPIMSEPKNSFTSQSSTPSGSGEQSTELKPLSLYIRKSSTTQTQRPSIPNDSAKMDENGGNVEVSIFSELIQLTHVQKKKDSIAVAPTITATGGATSSSSDNGSASSVAEATITTGNVQRELVWKQVAR